MLEVTDVKWNDVKEHYTDEEVNFMETERPSWSYYMICESMNGPMICSFYPEEGGYFLGVNTPAGIIRASLIGVHSVAFLPWAIPLSKGGEG